MKEIKSLVKFFESTKSLKENCAIAQVVRVEESSYRREGARMLVYESGVFEGGISGGCLEGDALKRSQMAIINQKPSVVTYDTSKDDQNQIGVGLGCNGIIDVLITPINKNSNIISTLKKCLEERKSHLLVTITDFNGSSNNLSLGKVFYVNLTTKEVENCEDEKFKKFIQENIDQVLQKSKSKIIQLTQDKYSLKALFEYLPAQYHLAIYGDNYDVYPILDLAKVMDWDVSLVGNINKLKKEKLFEVKNLFQKDLEKRPVIDERTAIILMSHDFKTDKNNLKSLIKSKSLYIGSLGPKKRFEKMIKELSNEGVDYSKDELSKVYAPCGLEIGANTPEEITTSIFAEILAAFSNKEGGSLKYKEGPIHEREN